MEWCAIYTNLPVNGIVRLWHLLVNVKGIEPEQDEILSHK